MNRIVPAALLFILVLTAGCLNSAPSPEDPDGENTSYPPGVTSEGISNTSRLFNAHSEVLENTTYRENATEILFINGSRRVITSIQKFSPGPNRTVNVTKTQVDNGTKVLVLNQWGPTEEGLIYIRQFDPQDINVTYGVTQSRSYLRLRNFTDEAKALIGQNIGSNQSVEQVDRGWRIRMGAGTGTNITLLVNESGLIREFRLVESQGPVPTSFILKTRFITALERPDWIDRARNSIGFTNNTTSTDNVST